MGRPRIPRKGRKYTLNSIHYGRLLARFAIQDKNNQASKPQVPWLDEFRPTARNPSIEAGSDFWDDKATIHGSASLVAQKVSLWGKGHIPKRAKQASNTADIAVIENVFGIAHTCTDKKLSGYKSRQGLMTALSRGFKKKLSPTVCRRLLLEYPFRLKKVISLKGEQIPNSWDLRSEYRQFDNLCNAVEEKWNSFL